ncbi:MAG: AmmeMemoRadiSam system radical SAM enzyme [Candidatus Hadarchaeum sp.]|uniref:AmmeMemoRadiSam system radical SAM enzyme n=1 Tax=Candidatus Hadarchaeum sp. TaxID=2883567 RepID=UPI003D10A777
MDPAQPWIRSALLYEKLGENRVKCRLCERRCKIPAGRTGYCRTRKNIDGNLYTLNYGNVSSIFANPIEKKPFYHFWPGSIALTVGGWSCNFACPWCQNWTISKSPPELQSASYLSPEDFVKRAIRERCQGTSISFNEPTLMFEYSLDVFRLARKHGLYNTFVSNGYMTTQALRELHEAGLDAINIDVKGDASVVRSYCGADVDVVWRNVREARKLGIHLEIVNLVIPGVNDREDQLRELVRRHHREAGRETPLHFTAYYPAYRFKAPPTPVATLERAYSLALAEGLEFVYIGNVPGHRCENTYCPGCGELLLRRYGLELLESRLKDKRCPRCGREIPVVGRINA